MYGGCWAEKDERRGVRKCEKGKRFQDLPNTLLEMFPENK